MENKDVITSPYYGVVKEVLIKKNSKIGDKETLFTVLTKEARIEDVIVNYSGCVHSLEVEEGEEVIPGMVLAYIDEDWSSE